jgi:DNA-binding CsgD family transcriptional regulator
MSLVANVVKQSVSAPALQRLPDIIDALGRDDFGTELIGMLNVTIGAEHCSVFRLDRHTPCEVVAVSRDGTDTAHRQFSRYLSGAYWRGDPAMVETIQGVGSDDFIMVRTDTKALPVGEFRSIFYGAKHIRERILLCGGTSECAIGISILRPEERGLATEQELFELGNLSSTLISLLSKHAGMLSRRADLSLALTSLCEIEATFKMTDVHFSPREAAVCARILFGISSIGIALDLGIGEETVLTYRKRAYQRLNIGSQRELLLWYIEQWGRRSSYPSLAKVSALS